MKNIFKKLNPIKAIKNYKNKPQHIKNRDIIRLASWGIPIALIPSFRYMQDKDKKPSLRKELFIRDFSTYSVGIGVFMGTAALAKKAFESPKAKKVSKNTAFIMTEVIASVVYCVWAGLLAPKLSQKVNKEGAGLKESRFSQVDNTIEKPVNFTRTLQAYRQGASKNLYSGFRI